MDFNKMIEDAKEKADTNDDGKLSIDDIRALSNDNDVNSSGVLDNLRDKADANDDGRFDFEDVKNGIEHFRNMVGDAGEHIGNTADDISGRMFGGNK